MVKAFFVHEYRGYSFARQLANGFKTKETRTRRTLDRLCGPDPVYIIRTGRGRRPMIIGKCKLSGPVWYDVEKLHRPETIDETFVFPGGPCDVETGGKWLYDVYDAKPLPYDVPVPENAIRHGRTWIEFDEKDVLKWYRF